MVGIMEKNMYKNQQEYMKDLVSKLNKASKAYYQDGVEGLCSNLEYDKMYDELVLLEKQTGVVLSDSPTVNVGYEVISRIT